MRVVVIHTAEEVAADYFDYPIFTGLSAWTLAAALETAGHTVHLVEACALPGAGPVRVASGWRFGADVPEVLAATLAEATDVIVMQLSPFAVARGLEATWRRLVAGLRREAPGVPLVLADMTIGGQHYLDYDEAAIFAGDTYPDYLLRYEAELALPALLAELERGGKPAERAIHGTPLQAPLPAYAGRAYELISRADYRAFLGRVLHEEPRANPFGFTRGSLPIKTSRGCAYACRFCTSGLASGGARGVRPLAANELRELIAHLALDPELDTLVVLDEAANLVASSFAALLDAAKLHHLKLAFPNGLRADRLDAETIARLAELCDLLSLSPESGSQALLARAIDKRQSLASVEMATEAARRAGMRVALHFVVGWPGERARELLDTFAFARRMWELYEAEPWLQFAVPFPGTPLYEEARQAGLLPTGDPAAWLAHFGREPVLKDGACGLPNATLRRLRNALRRHTQNQASVGRGDLE